MELFLQNRDLHINAYRDPDLDLYSVGRVAKEALNTQVLFDPFEE
jgi:hypothetical protein